MKRNVYYNILLFTACSCLPAVFFISVLEAKRLWSFSFPWHHALAAEAEYKDRLGYVKSFTVNGRSINETLQLYSPTGHDKDLNVSEGYFSSNGILNRFTWEFNDRKDPIFFQINNASIPELYELSFYLYPVKDQQKIYLKEYANAKNIGIFGGK